MLALLVFAYACCGIGVWFGWYLRGRRAARPAPIVVYGDSFVDDSPRAQRFRADEIRYGGNTAGSTSMTGAWVFDHDAQDSTE